MNPGRTVPPSGADPIPTTRQFISDLDVMILADAYGYTVTLPSTLDSAHTMLDSMTGQLLVQGLPDAVDDDIDITLVGTNNDTVRVVVNGHTEEVPLRDVSQIIIAGNGGTDTIDVATELETIRQDVNYVVSSNEDEVESSGVGDGVVDLDSIVPGNQTTLRAAIQDANGKSGADAIYVGRGTYELTRTGTESGSAANNDLDITSDVTLLGAGAGQTIVEGSFSTADPHTRLFEVATGGDLNVSQMTLTGGNASSFGGAISAQGNSLSLDKVAIVGNTAVNSGGGLHTLGTSTVITDSVFLNNTTSGNGAAIRSQDNGGTQDELKIGGTIFANNTKSSGNKSGGITAAENVTTMGNNITDFGTNAFTNGDYNDLIVTSPQAGNLQVVTSVADVIDSSNNGVALSLREAVIIANAGGSTEKTIWLPAWQHRLTIGGVSSSAATGDLDITGNVKIVGTGAGLSVIDAGGAGGLDDRLFEVATNGDLALSRLTLTGGNAISPAGGGANSGGAIFAHGDSLNLDQVAILDNYADGTGGALYISSSPATLTNSVLFANSANSVAAGAIRMQGTDASHKITISGTVFAQNTNSSDTSANGISDSARVINNGNNITDFTGPFSHGTNGDYVGTVDYVVTSVADTFDHTDDKYALSVREAFDNVNTNGSQATATEVWLPAWDFVLTRFESTTVYGQAINTGDLEITKSLTLRGIDNKTSIGWMPGVDHRVFDFVGNNDGLDGSDIVGQEDLDAVLLNWDELENTVAGIDEDLDSDDKISQGELDAVLLNWGNKFIWDNITLNV